jgi:hypothetical protein
MSATEDIPYEVSVVAPALDAFFIKYQASLDITFTGQRRPSGLIIFDVSHIDLGNVGKLTLQQLGGQITRLASDVEEPSLEETLLFDERVKLCLNNPDENEEYFYLVNRGFDQQQAIQMVLKTWRNSSSYVDDESIQQLHQQKPYLSIRAWALQLYKGLSVDDLGSDVAKAYAHADGTEMDQVDEENEVVCEAEYALTTARDALFDQRKHLIDQIRTGFIEYLRARGAWSVPQSNESTRPIWITHPISDSLAERPGEVAPSSPIESLPLPLPVVYAAARRFFSHTPMGRLRVIAHQRLSRGHMY